MKLIHDINESTLSNVGTTNEFKIKATAKSFQILSSGMYSNKIKAIIRELSCNAVDSHVAANKEDVPFEVHLPSSFEPWFSVKDFGTGLDENEIINVYTTYFESTKTNSNSFIGALGLGAKTPFSYTENFTVTSNKDGICRIYSAYINEQGVPSIVEMSKENTTEANGIEVKFSVVNKNDFLSFQSESRNVFMWFKIKPVIMGVHDFKCPTVEYLERDIVPGVHTRKTNTSHTNSMAIMGNIAYPLNDIPEVESHFGNLSCLLDCGLVIEFEIGELDFSASREKLSYIPLTINNIKKKLELLNLNIFDHLAVQANAIQSKWERSYFLYEKKNDKLYKAAIDKYATDTKFELYDPGYTSYKRIEVKTEDLNNCGIKIDGFRSNNGSSSKIKQYSKYSSNTQNIIWDIPVERSVVIVLNDLKTGCLTRAKYHFNKLSKCSTVFCISHDSPDLKIRQNEYDKLIIELHNPPVVLKASELEKEPTRTRTDIEQGIMCLKNRNNSYVWEPYVEVLEENKIYYYISLDNRRPTGLEGQSINISYIKQLMTTCGIESISSMEILGVRKSKIKEIGKLKNWVWFEEKLKEEVLKISDSFITMMLLSNYYNDYYNPLVGYNNEKVGLLVNPNSEYKKYIQKYPSDLKKVYGNVSDLTKLCQMYGKSIQVNNIQTSITDDKEMLYKRYPFLKLLKNGQNTLDNNQIADYINMVDKHGN